MNVVDLVRRRLDELRAEIRRADRWRRLFGSSDARVFILSDRLVVLRGEK